jgi:hypothetical protein
MDTEPNIILILLNIAVETYFTNTSLDKYWQGASNGKSIN